MIIKLSLLVGPLVSTVFVSSLAMANLNCREAVAGKKPRALELQETFGLTSEANAKLMEVLESQPELQSLLSDKDIRAYALGVIKGSSFLELRPTLFKIWAKSSENGEDVELKKLLGNTQVMSILQESTAEFSRKLSRKEKIAFKFSKFLIQLKALPRSLKRAKELIKSEMHPKVLDQNLFDFYGYLNLRLESSRVRSWNKVKGGFGAIDASQVVGIDPTAFSKIAMMAAEIEQPIGPYSDNSGETFRAVSPQASRFMGKTVEEAMAHRQKIDAVEETQYCTNSWCFEENRHEGALVNMVKNIVGYTMPMSEPFGAYPGLDPLNAGDAFFHMIARNSTEWNAGSAYFFLGSHAKDQLGDWMANVRQDELKHQSIFIGLYKYIFGDTPWKRLKGMVTKALMEIREKGNSIYGDSFGSEGLSVIELLYSHIVYEKEIRTFFRSLPLKTLRKVYETDINLKPLDSTGIDVAKAEQLSVMTAKETEMRRGLARWPKKQREFYEKLETFETENNELIMKVINVKFSDFAGAEDYGSQRHSELLKLIDKMTISEVEKEFSTKLDKASFLLLKTSLKETLRDYQVMNNASVRSAGMSVGLESAKSGFKILQDDAYEMQKKVKE